MTKEEYWQSQWQAGHLQGAHAMARNCLQALSKVKNGEWTVDDTRKWLEWVLANERGLIGTELFIP